MPRRSRFWIMLLLAACAPLLLAPATGHAAWSTDPTVNNPVALDHAAFLPFGSHRACSDGAGGMYVAWNGFSASAYSTLLQHVLANGTIAPGWPANGLRMTSSTIPQSYVQLVPDKSGGALVAWANNPGAGSDVYAQRVTSAGARLWGDGLKVSQASNDEVPMGIVEDGAHGMLLVWSLTYTASDHDVYAGHVLPGGTLDPAWPTGGLGVSASVFEEARPTIATDDAGGCWIAWQDNRASNFDIFIVRLTNAGSVSPGWTVGGFNTTSGELANQESPQLAADGTGGAFMAWLDYRNTSSDIFANHVVANRPGSTVRGGSGIAVVEEASVQDRLAMCADGAGGCFVTWDDYRGTYGRPFAMRLRWDATGYPGWPLNGLALTDGYGGSATPVPDGTGGAIVVWADNSSSSSDVAATRVTAGGSFAPGWSPHGNLVCAASNQALYPLPVADGSGGALCTWWDGRSFAGLDHYAGAIDRYGALGDARPAIASVRDVKADQGGAVQIRWNRSYLDSDPGFGIANYWIWRQVPATLVQRAVRAGGAWADAAADPAGLAAHGRRVFAATRDAQAAAAGYAWEFVASQPANAMATYSYVAATHTDSTAGHNPYMPVLVEAHAATSAAYWAAAPDSGYSVDNIPPATPSPFLGTYAAGVTSMNWGANTEADLSGYRLYRGSGGGFTPGPGNLVASPTTNAYVDHPGSSYVYKLTAIDAHGNESAVATLVPAGTTAVDDLAPTALEFALHGANPSRAGATLGFALPGPGRVRIAIFDAQGRYVRTLADASYAAGRYAVHWDGADASGDRVADGLYFARLESEGRVRQAKIVTCR